MFSRVTSGEVETFWNLEGRPSFDEGVEAAALEESGCREIEVGEEEADEAIERTDGSKDSDKKEEEEEDGNTDEDKDEDEAK